jgi:hypothetical protein
MGIEILIPLLAIFSIFFIPITGLMIILTARFALRPLAETLAKALRESGYAGPPEGSPQMRELVDRVEDLTREVERLKEAQDFDRKLLGKEGVSGGRPAQEPGAPPRERNEKAPGEMPW